MEVDRLGDGEGEPACRRVGEVAGSLPAGADDMVLEAARLGEAGECDEEVDNEVVGGNVVGGGERDEGGRELRSGMAVQGLHLL